MYIFILSCSSISFQKDFKRVWFICYFVNLRINTDPFILILEIWNEIQMFWFLKHKTIEFSVITILITLKKKNLYVVQQSIVTIAWTKTILKVGEKKDSDLSYLRCYQRWRHPENDPETVLWRLLLSFEDTEMSGR